MGLFDKKKKLLIIGLDGVPHGMIRDLTSGPAIMPNLKKIIATGRLQRMTVSLPEISSVSWSGFMTGTDSGNHGIFGFVDLPPGSYEYRFPNFGDLKTPTLFDDLGRKKKRSVVINLPATYPARPVPGALVSGFVALDLKRAVYPGKILPFLQKTGYEVDVEAGKAKDEPRQFLADLHTLLEKRKIAADYLWKKEKWDLFMLTVTGTDRLHHFFFDAYENKDHPFHEDFLGYYRAVDALIGEFYEKISGKEEFSLIILSDHGFGPIEQEVYLNPILKKHGFFETAATDPPSLETITENARAFALDPSRIYIHQKGKFPRGKVDARDYRPIREELKDLFENYRIGPDRVIKKVFFKEEIYSPRFLDRAPDIVLLSNPGYDLKGGLKKDVEYGRGRFTGMHLQDNAFFFCDRPASLPGEMTIFQARDVILDILK